MAVLGVLYGSSVSTVEKSALLYNKTFKSPAIMQDENSAVQRPAAYSPFKPGQATPAQLVASVKNSLATKKRAIVEIGASITSGILGGPAPYEEYLTSPEWRKRHRSTDEAGSSSGSAGVVQAAGAAVKAVAGRVKEEADIASKIDWRGEVKAEIVGAGSSIKQAAAAAVSAFFAACPGAHNFLRVVCAASDARRSRRLATSGLTRSLHRLGCAPRAAPLISALPPRVGASRRRGDGPHAGRDG